MPVASARPYVAARGACEPQPVHADLRTTCSTVVDETSCGPKRSSKGEPRVLGRYRACPSRGASGTRVAGSIRNEAWRAPPLVDPTEVHLGCRPAKGGTVGKTGVPSAALELLRERRMAPPCAPESKLRHAASFEGIARELSRLCCRFCGAFS